MTDPKDTILVVDDEPPVRQAMLRVVQGATVMVTGVSELDTAVQIATPLIVRRQLSQGIADAVAVTAPL